MVYGYCRISRKTQDIKRQERNIIEAYPDAYLVSEVFTGTRVQGRKKLDGLVSMVKKGDTIVFDSASRMSRNADEAVALYEDLFERGVNLVFLRERHIDTDVYKKALESKLDVNARTGNEDTDEFMNDLFVALDKYMKRLAKAQIRLVFEQAQKEVDDLHRRTSEGMMTAKLEGKQIGLKKGTKLKTDKSVKAKEAIEKYSCDFKGSLNDSEVIKLAGVSRNSYYKYKREMRERIAFGNAEEKTKSEFE